MCNVASLLRNDIVDEMIVVAQLPRSRSNKLQAFCSDMVVDDERLIHTDAAP